MVGALVDVLAGTLVAVGGTGEGFVVGGGGRVAVGWGRQLDKAMLTATRTTRKVKNGWLFFVIILFTLYAHVCPRGEVE